MSMAWIRDHYNVPAQRGMVVLFDGEQVRITSAKGAHLMVRREGERQSWPIHPTWRVAYVKCATFWGSHGCDRWRGHQGWHQCGPAGDERGPHSMVDQNGRDQHGHQWKLYTVEGIP